MRIHIATDHAGLDFSRDLQAHLAAVGHDVIDHGPASYDPLDDYPSFCINAAAAVVADRAAGVADRLRDAREAAGAVAQPEAERAAEGCGEMGHTGYVRPAGVSTVPYFAAGAADRDTEPVEVDDAHEPARLVQDRRACELRMRGVEGNRLATCVSWFCDRPDPTGVCAVDER